MFTDPGEWDVSIFGGGGEGEALFHLPPPAVDFRSLIGSLGYSPALAWAAITNTIDEVMTEMCFPLSGGWTKIKALAGLESDVGLFPRSQVAVLLLCPHWWEGWALYVASFTRALTPFMRPLPSRPPHLPKALPPKTITWGKVSTSMWGREGHKYLDHATP